MDYADRSKASIRYKIHLLPGSQRILEKYRYGFNDLVTDSGSWMGIWGLGITCLAIYQAYALPFGACTEEETFMQQYEQTVSKKAKRLKRIEMLFKTAGFKTRTVETALEEDSANNNAKVVPTEDSNNSVSESKDDPKI